MSNILPYILEVNTWIFILGFGLFLLFKNTTYHLLNRIIFLAAIGGAFLFPILNFEVSVAQLPTINLDEIIIGNEAQANSDQSYIPAINWISMVYFLGVGISFLAFLYQGFQLLSITRKSRVSYLSGKKIRIGHKLNQPSSFLTHLFWVDSVDDSDRDYILSHEEVHINEKHSLDLILLRVIQILCWFNPGVYLLFKGVKANHEFRADEVVANQTKSKARYSEIILSHAMGVNASVLAHSFSNKNLLKQRIMMLNKKQTKAKSFFIYTGLLPLLGLGLLVAACTKENPNNPEEDAMKSELIEEVIMEDKESVYKVVEKQPSFPGGKEGLMNYMMESIKYPDACKSDGIEGKVLVSFIVLESGDITDVKAVKSPDSRLSAAAVEVIQDMPKWIPGEHLGENVKVELILPIVYKMS